MIKDTKGFSVVRKGFFIKFVFLYTSKETSSEEVSLIIVLSSGDNNLL